MQKTMSLDLGDLEHSVEAKDFLGGGRTPTKVQNLTCTQGRLTLVDSSFSPRALKMLEELFLNVLDQEIRSTVDSLHVNFTGLQDPGGPTIEVINFGPGSANILLLTSGSRLSYRCS